MATYSYTTSDAEESVLATEVAMINATGAIEEPSYVPITGSTLIDRCISDYLDKLKSSIQGDYFRLGWNTFRNATPEVQSYVADKLGIPVPPVFL